MRLAAVLALGALLAGSTLLAGCTLPGTPTAKQSPLFGLCPQWEQGTSKETLGLHLNGTSNATRELGPADASLHGHPLDLYRIQVKRLVVDGRLEVRAHAADGKQLGIRDYRAAAPQITPVLVFTDGSASDHEFDVFLSPVAENGTAAPAPVSLQFRFTGTDALVDVDVTYHYKVCGIV
jgi:hypothetical protein